MITLVNDDMQRILGFLPKDIIDLMKAHPVFLGGGFVRARICGEPIADIDLFGPSEAACDVLATKIAVTRGVKVYRTKNAFSIISPPRAPVQFIHRWTFDNARALIDSFDFTIAKAAVWYDIKSQRWMSVADDAFYPDLAAKRLTYTFPARNEDAGGSLLRVQKFLKRGYDISPEQLGRVIARLVNNAHPSGLWSDGEESKAKVLTGLLRQADPLTIIDGLEVSRDSMDPPEPGELVPA